MAKQSVKTNGNAETPAAETTAAKEAKSGSKSYYFDSANVKTRSPTKDSVGLGFEFAGQENVELIMSELSADIRHLCEFQGANIKLQRSYNQAGKDMAVAREECVKARDNLLDGAWIDPNKSKGFRIADLVEAIVRQMTAENQDGESKRATIKTKLSAADETGEALRAKYLGNNDIKKQLAIIEQEKLDEKAKAVAALPSTGLAEAANDFA